MRLPSGARSLKKRKVATDIVNSTNNVLGHDLACKSKEVVLPIHFFYGLRTPNERFFSNIPNILANWAVWPNKLRGILECVW